MECQHPDEFLYKYQGRLIVGDQVDSLNPDQLLLRVWVFPPPFVSRFLRVAHLSIFLSFFLSFYLSFFLSFYFLYY